MNLLTNRPCVGRVLLAAGDWQYLAVLRTSFLVIELC